MEDDQLLSSSSDSSIRVPAHITRLTSPLHNGLRKDTGLTSQLKDKDSEFVSYRVFRETIRRLEERLSYFEERQHQAINSQLSGARSTSQFVPMDNSQEDCSEIKNRSPTYLSGIHDVSLQTEQRGQQRPKRKKPQESTVVNKSPITPQKEDALISRLNLFEKRQKQHEQRLAQLSKDLESWRREVDRSMQSQLKRISDENEKTKTIRQELISRIEELGQNQKAIIQHLHSTGQEITETQGQHNTLKEDHEHYVRLFDQRMSGFEGHCTSNDDHIKDLQQFQLSMENDVLMILRNYKEMLTEVLKIQMISEDVKHLYTVMEHSQ